MINYPGGWFDEEQLPIRIHSYGEINYDFNYPEMAEYTKYQCQNCHVGFDIFYPKL